MTTRRRLFGAAAALAPAAALVATSGRAMAFTMEPLDPASPGGLAYANRCGGDTGHPSILSRLEAELAGREAGAGEALSAAATCPFCGCPVVATRTAR